MVKKISFLILSAAILVIGVKGFSKLGYWDRSVKIFNYSSDTPSEGRIGREGNLGAENLNALRDREEERDLCVLKCVNCMTA